MPELETVDLKGVEIMAAGGPVRGLGSPPEGDTFTPENLRTMADLAREYRAEGVKPPAKIGHESTAPRVGWLDNIRTSKDGSSLLADIRDVPRKFASLVKAGAWRARSPELCYVTSQKTGKRELSIAGMAWLGGKLPAINKLCDLDAKLDEVFALYEHGDAELARVFEFENPDPPASERILEAVLDYAGFSERPPDTRTMAELTITEEQRDKAAEKIGVKPEELTVEKLLEAVKAEDEESKPDDSDSGDEDKPDEAARALEAKVDEQARKLEAAEKKLHETERREFVSGLITSARIEPGEREKWEKRFDKDPEIAREYAADLEPDEDLARAYGSDDDGSGSSGAKTEEQDKQEREEIARTFNLDLEEVA